MTASNSVHEVRSPLAGSQDEYRPGGCLLLTEMGPVEDANTGIRPIASCLVGCDRSAVQSSPTDGLQKALAREAPSQIG